MSVADIIKSKVTKTGTALVGGGTALGIIVTLLTNRIDHVDQSIDKKEVQIMREVDYKHAQITVRLDGIEGQLQDVKDLLIKLDNRLYDLNKKDLYSSKVEGENNTN